MLFYKTIDTQTLELLKGLLSVPAFSNLRLAGGTSLALQYGHRQSIDLDLFGVLTADEITISKELSGFGNLTIIKNSPNIHIYSLNGIKIDIVNYDYPWLETFIAEAGLRLAHEKDIGAMKLAAVTGRGTKKDFIDLYFLLSRFSLKDLITAYKAKYHDGSEFLVLKSLTYFDDAEKDAEPKMLIPVSWKLIKEKIILTHNEYFKNSL